MKRFFLNLLSHVFTSVLLTAVIFFAFVSIHSGKFPPTIALVKDYINSVAKAKENYTALVQKSEKYIKTELADDGPATPKTSDEDHAELDEINANLKQIKIQLNRIEQQNSQFLRNQKK